jgi:hypothetical protein
MISKRLYNFLKNADRFCKLASKNQKMRNLLLLFALMPLFCKGQDRSGEINLLNAKVSAIEQKLNVAGSELIAYKKQYNAGVTLQSLGAISLLYGVIASSNYKQGDSGMNPILFSYLGGGLLLSGTVVVTLSNGHIKAAGYALRRNN